MDGKTLVVIGYHSDELGWGKRVRETFGGEYPDVGDVRFLEITDSPVKTGFDSAEANRIIQEEVKRVGDVRLLFDVHCDTSKNYGVEDNGDTTILYSGDDPAKVEEINRKYVSCIPFPPARVADGASIDFLLRRGTAVKEAVRSETLLTPNSFQERDTVCRKAEKDVAGIIYDLHRMHVLEKISPDSLTGENAKRKLKA